MPRSEKHSEETKRKISASMMNNQNRTGIRFSEQALQDRTKINKDKIVYNNGERNIFLMIGQEVPEGFTRGVYITEEEKKRRSDRMKELNKKRWDNWRKQHGKECSNAEPSQ